MGRNKKYQQADVIQKMTNLFIEKGYNATSLDDLVSVTGILRGSLYSAFGSKQKMFIQSLVHSLENDPLSDESIGMAIISMLELSDKSKQVKEIIQEWYQQNDNQGIEKIIGRYIINKSEIDGDGLNG